MRSTLGLFGLLIALGCSGESAVAAPVNGTITVNFSGTFVNPVPYPPSSYGKGKCNVDVTIIPNSNTSLSNTTINSAVDYYLQSTNQKSGKAKFKPATAKTFSCSVIVPYTVPDTKGYALLIEYKLRYYDYIESTRQSTSRTSGRQTLDKVFLFPLKITTYNIKANLYDN